MSSGPNRGPPGVGDEDEDEYVMESVFVCCFLPLSVV